MASTLEKRRSERRKRRTQEGTLGTSKTTSACRSPPRTRGHKPQGLTPRAG